jgi:inner membrane protein
MFGQLSPLATMGNSMTPTDTDDWQGASDAPTPEARRGPKQPWHRRFGLGEPGFDATKRAFFLGILTLTLLIPLGMIGDLVQERSAREAEVDAEITSQWGGPQIVAGPILAVPYRYVSEAGDGVTERMATSFLYFLPKQLDISAEAKTEKRSKSIYEVLVYGGQAELTGHFADLAAAPTAIAPENIDWSGARLILGIAEPDAIRELKIAVNGGSAVPEDRLRPDPWLNDGLNAAIPLTAADLAKPLDFKIDLAVNGSGAMRFVALGDVTTLALRADWPHPDFSGRALPDRREISTAGFTAHWSLNVLSRGIPSAWRGGALNPAALWNGAIGVAFVEPGDVHQRTDRILKYGVLVIALTFATIFLNGLMSRRRVHPMQYLLVGAALCLFYLLLLSLAEQLPFGWAYLVASAADIAVVGWYAWRTMSRRLGYLTGALLALLQAYMYVLLQMEDYALLSGTLALFAVLLAAMIGTRNIDWYRIGGNAERQAA